nr:GtrA family protein [Butyrivibrio sp.]
MSIGKFIWNIVETIVRGVFGFIFKLIGKEYTDSVHEGLMQFVKFGIVGLSNTVLSYVLYAVSLLGMQKAGLFPKVDYLIAQIIA